MSASKSKVTLHVVSSLDGFIAKKNNSVSWLEVMEMFTNEGLLKTVLKRSSKLSTAFC